MTNWVEILTGETTSKLLSLLRRSRLTITALADALHLTDNAVRTHIAALKRDGIVEHVGTQRETGGKPARVYALTSEGEELFPKAYALVLSGLVEEIARVDGWERATELLGAVANASGTVPPADREGRVAVAAAALRSLGGDVEVQRTERGIPLQGYGCPLYGGDGEAPGNLRLGPGSGEGITGRPVTECCDRNGRPRCGFRIDDEPVSPRAVARVLRGA